MEEQEKNYLQNTLKVINKKIEKTQIEISQLKSLFEEKRAELGNNFYEYKQGQDLASTFTNLSQIEEQQLNSEKQLKKLKFQNNSPYFARIDFQTSNSNAQKIYIGLGSIIYNKKVYVVDWRTPIASMYYEYELGKASYEANNKTVDGEILLKRQYKIENQQLLSYFDTNLTINDEILQEILSKNASDKMRQIVSTIQKEQNTIIRTEKNDNILVQGVAGSGKTSIALHKAAYLLYKHRHSLKSNDILVLSPNNIFSSYISEVLPQLGEDNLVETTFAQIVKTELKRPLQPREDMLDDLATKATQEQLNEISYKSSYEFLDSLLRFLKGPLTDIFTPKTLKYVIKETEDGEKEEIIFTEEETRNLFFKTFKGYDFYERINKIAWQYAMVFTEKRHYNKSQHRGLKERFKQILYKFMPIRDVEQVFQIFMAREKLSARKTTTINYMDKGTYLAIKHYLYGIDHDFSAKYLIIDEMQDFTPVDIYMFKKLWTCPCIIVGDVNQCIEKNLTDEYLQLTADFLGCKIYNLNKTYRSTQEIATFANQMMSIKNVDYVNRRGSSPIVYQTLNQGEIISKIIKEECAEFAHVAIICKCNKEAKEVCKLLNGYVDYVFMKEPDDYKNKVLVTTCATAKGIEFDAVIVPFADEKNYKNNLEKNILYISSTRALHKLFFTTDKNPTKFVKSLAVKKV